MSIARVRRAFAFTSAERYVVLALNFAMVAAIARLLTPEEIGLSVIGAATLAFGEMLRDFGTSTFIVQKRDLTRDDSRTAFTIMLLLSVALSAGLWLLAGALAAFYQRPELTAFFKVLAVGFLAGPFAGPLMALMRRDMAFGTVALINVLSAATATSLTVLLAWMGMSYMSFAWAVLAGAWSAAVLAVALRRDVWIFRPHLAGWRETLSFGAYSSAVGLLMKTHEYLPSLILGRVLSLSAVGFQSRAILVCQIPDKAVFAGLNPVALPAIATAVREGHCVKRIYTGILTHTTALQWPALILTAFLAHPIVLVFLGPNWGEVVPLVQIMAVASLFSFPIAFAFPILVAAGGIRYMLVAYAIFLPLCAAVVAAAAPFGLMAATLSLFLTIPIQVVVTVHFIRKVVPITWSDLLASVRGSAIVALCSGVGPACVIAAQGNARFDLPLGAAAVAAALAGVGWTVGLRLTRHPFLDQLVALWHLLPRRIARIVPEPATADAPNVPPSSRTEGPARGG